MSWFRRAWFRRAKPLMPPAEGQEIVCTVATGPGAGLLLSFQFTNGDEIVVAMPRAAAQEYLDAVLDCLGIDE